MNGSAHFPMQSVYKLPIAMALLHLVDEAELSLDQSVASGRTNTSPGASTAHFAMNFLVEPARPCAN